MITGFCANFGLTKLSGICFHVAKNTHPLTAIYMPSTNIYNLHQIASVPEWLHHWGISHQCCCVQCCASGAVMDLCANLSWLVDPWNETHIVRRGSSAYQECGQRLKDDGFNCDPKTLPSTVVRVLQLFVWHFMVSKSFSKHQQISKLVFPWPRFCLQILCSISLNDPLYLIKSAKHQDLTNVQMSRIGSCDQRRNSDIWFWHIEVCLGLVVDDDINMTRKCHTHDTSMSIYFFLPGHLFENFCTVFIKDPHHHYPPNKISNS